MSPRRLTLTLAACLLLGFLINFTIAALLSIRPDHGAAPMGFGFLDKTFAPTVTWVGDCGRDMLGIASPQGSAATSTTELQTRFRSIFGQPNGTMTPPVLDEWSARLFPRYGEWVYHVTAAEGSRRMYAAGFPLRSFAGYDTGAQVSFGFPKPPGGFRQQGFLWRADNGPLRAIVYIPMPLGTAVNTLLYGSLFFAAAMTPSLRRSLRLHRGHCPRCNYDLRGDLPSGCPECGWNRAAPAKT